jgi:hypothetical protein
MDAELPFVFYGEARHLLNHHIKGTIENVNIDIQDAKEQLQKYSYVDEIADYDSDKQKFRKIRGILKKREKAERTERKMIPWPDTSPTAEPSKVERLGKHNMIKGGDTTFDELCKNDIVFEDESSKDMLGLGKEHPAITHTPTTPPRDTSTDPAPCVSEESRGAEQKQKPMILNPPVTQLRSPWKESPHACREKESRRKKLMSLALDKYLAVRRFKQQQIFLLKFSKGLMDESKQLTKLGEWTFKASPIG